MYTHQINKRSLRPKKIIILAAAFIIIAFTIATIIILGSYRASMVPIERELAVDLSTIVE